MDRPSTLITGAAGFAGRHLLTHLQNRQTAGRILAWSRRPPVDRHSAIEWRQVEMTNREAVTQAIIDTRPDRVVHLAGAPHVGQSWQDAATPLQTNVMGTHHLLEAIRVHHPGCRVLVVTSAMVYRVSDGPLDEDAPVGSTSPYGFSKLAQDQLALRAAHDDHLDVVIARPFNHVGPGQDPGFFLSSFAKQIALIEAGRLPAQLRVGNLDAQRDLTDVRDVVEAYVRLLESGVTGRAYNISSDTAHRIGDLLDDLIGLARVPVTREIDPERLRPNDAPRLVGNSLRIRTELGWKPSRTIAATLADTLDAWRAEVAGSLAP